MLRVTTATGAVYKIDREVRAFFRTQGKHAIVGDPDGSLTHVVTRYETMSEPTVGKRLHFDGVPGVESLHTSRVVSVEEIDE